jgi:hypothetical protein
LDFTHQQPIQILDAVYRCMQRILEDFQKGYSLQPWIECDAGDVEGMWFGGQLKII